MALPPDKRIKFFVYIIESPSAVDLYHKRYEGDLLKQAINLNLIPCTDRVAISREAFEAAIKVGLHEDMQLFPNMIPILHISSHGSSDGVQLSNGELIRWEELRELLKPVNKALKGGLLLCMSSCEGYSGCRMAMFPEDPEHPFFAIVGNSSKPSWSETAIAYATFYHLIAKGEFITTAVDAMRVASGNNDFFVITAEEAHKGYLEYIDKLNAGLIQQQLQSEVQEEPSDKLAKLMELSNKRTS